MGKRLSEEQELALCHYLDRLDQVGAAARRPMLMHCANALLQQSHNDLTNPPPTIGRNWPQRFLERHPEYHIRKQKSLAVERKNAHDPEAIQRWFEDYHRLIQEKGITETDIYNADETRFKIGIGCNQWIITRDHSRQAYLASSSNHEMMTCMETISGDEVILPPMMIFSATQHMEH